MMCNGELKVVGNVKLQFSPFLGILQFRNDSRNETPGFLKLGLRARHVSASFGAFVSHSAEISACDILTFDYGMSISWPVSSPSHAPHWIAQRKHLGGKFTPTLTLVYGLMYKRFKRMQSPNHGNE